MIRRRYYLTMLAAFACTTLWAVAADPAPEQVEVNRRRFEAIRKHPETLAKLRETLQMFDALPEKRQQAIVKLDQEMHEIAPKRQDRMWNVLARYADWLEQLKKKDPKAYQAIKDAPDSATRLALIKEGRDREWMETQPKKYRDEWEKLNGEDRTKLVAKLREEECVRHQQWVITQRFWSQIDSKQTMPVRLSDFAVKGKKKDEELNKVREYVTEYLLPYLSDMEKKKLEDAEGRWPDYPKALVEIARKRPSALPPPKLPTHFNDLPKPVRAQVTLDKKGFKKKLLQELQAFEGRDIFAIKIVEIGTRKGGQPFEHEFWPSTWKSLQPPMKDFVDKELKPKLTKAELNQLNDSDGRWPDYPNTIQELAKKYEMQPPWHYLPEPEKWRWEDYYRVPKCRSWAEIAKAKAGT